MILSNWVNVLFCQIGQLFGALLLGSSLFVHIILSISFICQLFGALLFHLCLLISQQAWQNFVRFVMFDKIFTDSKILPNPSKSSTKFHHAIFILHLWKISMFQVYQANTFRNHTYMKSSSTSIIDLLVFFTLSQHWTNFTTNNYHTCPKKEFMFGTVCWGGGGG